MDQIMHWLGTLPQPSWHWLSWALLALIILWPFLRKRGPSLASVRAQLIGQIEQVRGTRVLAIIHHRQRSYAAMRAPRDHIDGDTAEEFLSVMRRIKPTQPIDIILHTPGGWLTAAQQIASALKAHKGRKTVFVPYQAWSAGTLIALAADEIVMGPQAVLGPIDPQIGGLPAVSLQKLVKEKSKDAVEDIFFILAEEAGKAIDETRKAACELINPVHHTGTECALTDGLSAGARSHGDPIMFEEAKREGLNVAQGVPEAMFTLVDLCRDPRDEPAMRHRGKP
jgi:membrane-bound ClpP family serine protease